MKDQIKLSLCMITNNDQNYIRSCLQSIKDIADEIIIADMGSSDETVAAAMQEGAQVYQVAISDSYSEIKNFCMDHALGQWVLFLQPDEVIPQEQHQKLRLLLENPNAEAYLTLVDYRSDNFRFASPVQSMRLVKNHKENRFRYRSFEAIPDEKLTGIVNSAVQIIHLDDAMNSWELISRCAILQEEASAHPQDSYLQYMLGLIFMNQSTYTKSIESFQAARVGANPGFLFTPHLYKCLGWTYLYMEQYDEGLEVLNAGILLCPSYTDLLVLRAEIYKQTGQYDNAFKDLHLCLAKMQSPNAAVPMADISQAQVFASMGELSELAAAYNNALLYYMQAFQLDSADMDLLYKVGELTIAAESEKYIDNLIDMALEQQNPTLLAAILEMLQHIHAFDKISSRIDDIAPVLGNEQTADIALACRLMTGAAKPADVVNRISFNIFLRAVESFWFCGLWDEAETLIDKFADSLLEDLNEADLFPAVHRLLTGKQTSEDNPLSQHAYETALLIHHDLLWKGREDMAKRLLPLLARYQDDEMCLKLALPWAKAGDYEALLSIYSMISSSKAKEEFIQKIILELLKHDHAPVACKIKDLGGFALPDALERLLQVGLLHQEIQNTPIETDGTRAKALPLSMPPNRDLARFYHSLCAQDENSASPEPAIAKMHERIGEHYFASGKTAEALCAYCKALQLQPYDFTIQHGLLTLIGNVLCADGLIGMLESKEYIDGCLGYRSLRQFIDGLKLLYGGLFKQAKELFSQTADNSAPSQLLKDHADACIWLEQHCGDTANEQFTPQACSVAVKCICSNYLLSQLRKDPGLYVETNLWMSEKISRWISEIWR
jgi:glycosyltransferase involved in cell wall biosynthesis